MLQFNHIFDITAAHVGLANFSIEVVFLQFGALFGAINMYLLTIRQADAPRSLLSVIPDQFVLRQFTRDSLTMRASTSVRFLSFISATVSFGGAQDRGSFLKRPMSITPEIIAKKERVSFSLVVTTDWTLTDDV